MMFLDLDKTWEIWEKARQEIARIMDEKPDLDEVLDLAEELLEETVRLAGTATVNFIAFWAYVTGITDVPPIFGGKNEDHFCQRKRKGTGTS